MNIQISIGSIISLLGDLTLFVFETIRSGRHFWRRRGLFLKQCEFIGVSSLGIIVAAALFMGAVLGYQLYMSLAIFGAEGMLGGSLGVSLFRELSPVMASIMVTGRAGAAMAAEISSMRVSEQIDALEVMAVDPIEYLVFPRVFAGVLVMPILTIVFTIVAIISGCAISCGIMGLQYGVFWDRLLYVVDPIDMVHCLVKSATFGLVLTWISCFCGFRAYGGARAVGEATRNTVVVTCLSILLSDYLLTSFLPFGMKKLEVM